MWDHLRCSSFRCSLFANKESMWRCKQPSEEQDAFEGVLTGLLDFSRREVQNSVEEKCCLRFAHLCRLVKQEAILLKNITHERMQLNACWANQSDCTWSPSLTGTSVSADFICRSINSRLYLLCVLKEYCTAGSICYKRCSNNSVCGIMLITTIQM